MSLWDAIDFAPLTFYLYLVQGGPGAEAGDWCTLMCDFISGKPTAGLLMDSGEAAAHDKTNGTHANPKP